MKFILSILAAGCLWAGDAWAAEGARQYLKRPDAWFAGAEAKRVAANILSWQADLGGWPKNEDTAAKPFTGDRTTLKPTFDNGATTDELRFLAHRVQATHDDACRQAFAKGLKHILQAQYLTGGWPQFYPPGTGYHRHITFNDNAMVKLMEFLREVYGSNLYDFVAATDKQAARQAFDRGIQCILKCQIKVDGKLTAWCAQHDEIDYRPRHARKYELVSLSGAESVGITRLLMSLDQPSPEVIASVEAAIAWFEKAKLAGIKVVEFKDKQAPGGKDRRVELVPGAPPLWARFYEIGTGKPIFCDRDGIVKYQLSEIGHERRNGYAWLDTWPQSLLEKDYPQWKVKIKQAN
jgi:pectate lyase